MPENINHPQHYGGDTTYEAIKVIEAWNLGFCLGNAIKYICRAGKKRSATDDLRKAIWYLNRELEKLQKFDLSKVVDKQIRLKILPPPETPFSSTLPLTIGDIGDVFDLQNGLIAVRFAAGDIWLNPIWVEFL